MMTTQKISFRYALGVMVAIVLLTGCGNNDTSSSSANAAGRSLTSTPLSNVPTAGPLATAATTAMTGATAGANGDVTKLPVENGATITLLVTGNQTEQQLYLDGVNRFHEVFPNVKVNFQVVPDQIDTALQAGFSAGTAADVFLLDPQGMGEFGPQGLLLDLSSAMQQASVPASDYYEAQLSVFQSNGKIYGIPKDFNPLVLFINTAIAQKAGVDPSKIKTWADMQVAAQKMTSGTGAEKSYGLCIDPEIARVGAQLLQLGNPIIQNGKATFNDTNGATAINFWNSFIQSGSGQIYQNMGKTWCGEAFAAQTAAMDYEGGWLVTYLADPSNGAQNVPYTAIPFPTPPNGKPASWLFTNGFGVSAKTKYPNASAALALFLTSAANERALIPADLALPSLRALASDPFFAQNPVYQLLVQQAAYGTDISTALGGPQQFQNVQNAINTQVLQPIFQASAPVQQTLQSGAQAVDQALAQ